MTYLLFLKITVILSVSITLCLATNSNIEVGPALVGVETSTAFLNPRDPRKKSKTSKSEAKTTTSSSSKTSKTISSSSKVTSSSKITSSSSRPISSIAKVTSTPKITSSTSTPKVTSSSKLTSSTSKVSSSVTASSASSVSSSKTSSSASATCTSGCSQCFSYQGDGFDVSIDTDSTTNNTQNKGSIAGRIEIPYHLFEKRGLDFNKIGDCTLDHWLEIPDYPKAGELSNYASGGAQFWWIMSETTASDTCAVLDYKKVTDSELTSQKINSGDANSYQKGGGWSRKTPTVNVDHVYELTILKQFFGSRVTSENCDAFKAIFDVADRASTPAAGENQATRLQTIWNQLPSRINPDFAGMDNQINGRKANCFSKDFPNAKSADDNLGLLYEIGMAMKLTNDDAVAPLFRKTNIRVYEALLGIDVVIQAAGSSDSTIKADWASSYKTWMTEYLKTQSTMVNTKVGNILKRKLGPNIQAKTASISNGVAAFLKAYPTPASFTFDADKLLEFPTTKTLRIEKRHTSTQLAGPMVTVPPTV